MHLLMIVWRTTIPLSRAFQNDKTQRSNFPPTKLYIYGTHVEYFIPYSVHLALKVTVFSPDQKVKRGDNILLCQFFLGTKKISVFPQLIIIYKHEPVLIKKHPLNCLWLLKTRLLQRCGLPAVALILQDAFVSKYIFQGHNNKTLNCIYLDVQPSLNQKIIHLCSRNLHVLIYLAVKQTCTRIVLIGFTTNALITHIVR